jgi:hypothetical protein
MTVKPDGQTKQQGMLPRRFADFESHPSYCVLNRASPWMVAPGRMGSVVSMVLRVLSVPRRRPCFLRRQLKSSWMEWPWEMSNFLFSISCSLSRRDFAGLAGSQRDAARSVCRHWLFGCRWLAGDAAGQAAVPLLLVGLKAECVLFLLHNPGGAVVAGRAALRDQPDRLPMPGSNAIIDPGVRTRPSAHDNGHASKLRSTAS